MVGSPPDEAGIRQEGAITGDVTRAIAAFASAARFEDLPAAVVERGRLHVLDSLGLALAGAGSDVARLVREHLAEQGAIGAGAAIFGAGRRAPPRFAALANACAIHADNFDDTTPQIRPERTGGIHASGAVLPAALAVGEVANASGRDVLLAYFVGVEVASRLNHAMAPRHYGEGFHTTGTLNVFGAAAAVAALRGLDADATVRAIGIAASQAAGVRRNFGTMAEILHPGLAAEGGIVAADLARRGVTSAPDALDGPVGYLAAAGGGHDPAEIVDRLGAPWVFEDPGVWIKPHPNGALTHPGAGALLALVEDHDVAAGDIAAIRVRTNERVLKTLIHHRPANAMQAKFSMEFTLAVVAVERRAGLAEFTDAVLARPDIRDMMARVSYGAYDQAGPDFTNVTTLLDLELRDGRTLTARADHARGSTAAPMTPDEVAAKFRQCAAYGGMPPPAAEAVIDAVMLLDGEGNVSVLSAALMS